MSGYAVLSFHISDDGELNYGDFETRTGMITTLIGHQGGICKPAYKNFSTSIQIIAVNMKCNG